MYCCFTREPSFWRSKLKESRSEDTVAEYSFTGMATNPKEMVSEAIERACVAMVSDIPQNESWANSNSYNEKRARYYFDRIYGPSAGTISRNFHGISWGTQWFGGICANRCRFIAGKFINK